MTLLFWKKVLLMILIKETTSYQITKLKIQVFFLISQIREGVEELLKGYTMIKNSKYGNV